MNIVPMFLGTGEIIALVVVAILLFGGSKLAGIGKASGRAIREFKEETAALNEKPQPESPSTPIVNLTNNVQAAPTQPSVTESQVVDPERPQQ